MFKINDKVKVIKCESTKYYERTYGAEGTVVSVLKKYHKYAVKFEDIENPYSQYGYFYFVEGDLELVNEKCTSVDYKNSPKRNMSTIFTVTEGKRERKSHEKGKPRIIDTISTTVKTDLGEATTTCDKSNYYDVYTGALVASAKLTASRSEDAMLLYKTAMDMWGNEMCTSILKALANRAFGEDKFDWVYKKWSKSVAQVEREKDKKACTCSVCGRVFKIPEDARAHEKWHRDCKLRREELKEARRRLRDLEKETNIESFMKELKDKKTSKKKNTKKSSNK